LLLVAHEATSSKGFFMKFGILGSALCLGLFVSMSAATVEAGCGTCDKTVVENAANNESFSTLVAAIKAAGLAETLSGSGPFTVFAPTNEAFKKLPAGTVEDLLKPENKAKLVAILTYHVVPGTVKAKDVVNLKEAKTVEGSNIAITVKDGAVMVNNAKVVKTDITSSNGVIHVIDTVILPKK
jgi:uncharacterized surface protein with fasciclin (FAS1) repeats